MQEAVWVTAWAGPEVSSPPSPGFTCQLGSLDPLLILASSPTEQRDWVDPGQTHSSLCPCRHRGATLG